MRTAMRVSGVMLDGLASGAIGASAGTDGCLICVGILSAFISIINVEEWTRRKNQGVVGEQMAMAANDHPGLTTPGQMGAWNFDTVPGLARVAKEIMRQSVMIGYLNAFTMYTVASALAVVFVLMVRRRRRPATS